MSYKNFDWAICDAMNKITSIQRILILEYWLYQSRKKENFISIISNIVCTTKCMSKGRSLNFQSLVLDVLYPADGW